MSGKVESGTPFGMYSTTTLNSVVGVILALAIAVELITLSAVINLSCFRVQTYLSKPQKSEVFLTFSYWGAYCQHLKSTAPFINTGRDTTPLIS